MMQSKLLLKAFQRRGGSSISGQILKKHFSTLLAENSTSTVPESAGSKSHALNQHRLTSDQLQFQALATDFARKELLPYAAEWDEHKHFPVDVIRKAANLGFGGLFCGQDVGGSELSRADGAIIFESLAYGDVSTVAYLSIHNMCCSLIDKFGTPEQRKDWLPRLTSLELLSSFSLTEPSSGSDAASLQTTAHREQGSSDYVLNGSKAFVSGGGVSDIYLLMARTGAQGAKGISFFLVEKGMPGLSFGRQEDKHGWRSQPTATVILDNVRVPARNLIGQEGKGFNIALTGLDGGRINIASCSVGGAQYCFDAALDYVHTRKQFGKAIVEFQNTQFKLADMITALQASRLMVANAAAAFDSRSPGSSASIAMAKRFATDTCYGICNDSLQLLGGYGYLKDYMVERYVRDLRVHSILEGTNEIMRVVIARHLTNF